ncbi:helix-turn-helix domain-containing protein [Paenibacillus phoenicis]|uniref:Helix-turn-helix domain-containing protein n=1 Tax=Paenibacillus phoenicis TaxID=554117 RepID=A0ABU5PIK6_9BACL|nr:MULTISPECIES: TetR/AcrR family transcriptional regulator [Paenibacillus]MCT2196833.1 TetR/AcrR family transcriptional regulator [Paenibacillus sp. p3-SID1389]MEA3569723.1 helix-turn-helix domain-containing protein [Paenibacillus phoenicis]
MELFWEKGFERTSIQDLVDRTGVHRGSLYDTFGDKNQLFLNCLDRFQEVTKDQAFRILEEDGEPKELLQLYFDSLIDVALNNETGRRGCFIANTAMELGAVDSEISTRIEAFTSDMEMAFINF